MNVGCNLRLNNEKESLIEPVDYKWLQERKKKDLKVVLIGLYINKYEFSRKI